MAIGACLKTVMGTLPRSSLSPPEQLLWVIDRSLEDDYSLLESAEDLLKRRAYTRSHWREVADTLEARFDQTPGYFRQVRSFIPSFSEYSPIFHSRDAYGIHASAFPSIADSIRAGVLATSLGDVAPPPWAVSLIFAERRLILQKVRALLDFAAPRLKAGLSAIAADESLGR